MYWAEALAEQTEDTELQASFTALAQELKGNEQKIIDELNAHQGQHVDIGGYYHPDLEKISKAMRPSATLNSLLDA